SIAARTVGQMIQVIVSDDGIGMSERAVAAAFDPSINVSRRGTAGEKGGGYGLLLAKAYIDQFGASVTIESVPQDKNQSRSGTKIIINFQTTHTTASSRSFRQRWRIMQ
ncbi:MAG: ATP-binding protein, partial [Proteobacteria bacterium]